jgi:hypothetical protein
MAKSFRTSISVSEDLKARMDAVGEGVNWSAVACRAFEVKLGEIASQKGQKDMKDVVDRLRASKQKTQDRDRVEGGDQGREWAKTTADADELQNLAQAVDRAYLDGGVEAMFGLIDTGRSRYTPAEKFFFWINHGTTGDIDELDRQAAYEFWGTVLGDDNVPNKPAFVVGFAEGAIEVWREVEDQL